MDNKDHDIIDVLYDYYYNDIDNKTNITKTTILTEFDDEISDISDQSYDDNNKKINYKLLVTPFLIFGIMVLLQRYNKFK
jgi:hypothetical protein